MPFLNIFSSKKIKKESSTTIIADHREKNSLVIAELMALNIKVEFKQLPIADYLIRNIAIERKTIQDLKSSIINKRIVQQLIGLKQYPSHFLIIEGLENKDLYAPPLHENALRGFLLSVALEYKVPIIFTQNPKDTAKYLYILAKKKTKSEHSIRPSKILKSTQEQIQFILEGFPNIGPTKAKKLIKKFKSLKSVINAKIEELQDILGKKAEEFKSLIEKEIKKLKSK